MDGRIQGVGVWGCRIECFDWSSWWVHLPWGHGGPRPSGGSGAQPLGSAECNDCMQTAGGRVSDSSLPVCGEGLWHSGPLAMLAWHCAAVWKRTDPAAILRDNLANWTIYSKFLMFFYVLPRFPIDVCCDDQEIKTQLERGHSLLLGQHGQVSLSLRAEMWLAPGRLEAEPERRGRRTWGLGYVFLLRSQTFWRVCRCFSLFLSKQHIGNDWN